MNLLGLFAYGCGTILGTQQGRELPMRAKPDKSKNTPGVCDQADNMMLMKMKLKLMLLMMMMI